MTTIRDRMPVILTQEIEDIGLDRSITDTDVLMSVLQPYSENMYTKRFRCGVEVRRGSSQTAKARAVPLDLTYTPTNTI